MALERGIDLVRAIDYARLSFHGGSCWRALRPGLVTGRIARPVRSRRVQISTATGTSPVPEAARVTPQFRDVISTTPLLTWTKNTGATVWIMATVAPITTEQIREIVRVRAETIKRTAPLDVDDQAGDPRSHLRIMGFFNSADGVGRIVEIDGEFLRD